MSTRYKVKLTKKAKKYLDKQDSPTRKRLISVLDQLREDPFFVSNVKPLTGYSKDVYRIRVGNLRILYQVEQDQLLITVINIGPRGDIYKK